MWAAANDGTAVRRRRRHHDKRLRIINSDGKDQEDSKQNDMAMSSDSDSDSSSDGERSTTESVHDNEPGENNIALQSTAAAITQPAQGNSSHTPTTTTAALAAIAGQKRRKRKRKKKREKQREETPEATMARLKSSYSAAMAAVGALHRVSHQYCTFWKKEEGEKQNDAIGDGSKLYAAPSTIPKGRDTAINGDKNKADMDETDQELSKKEIEATEETIKEKQQKAHSTIQRVGQAARTALEQSLLLDPILLAPILLPEKKPTKGITKTSNNTTTSSEAHCENNSIEDMSSAWLDAWSSASQNAVTSNAAACQISLAKWNKLSAAHRTVIRQLSYLALVNYADLLLCGCTCYRPELGAGQRRDILDRGAVSNLDILKVLAAGQQMRNGPIDTNHVGSPLVGSCHSSSSCLWSNESTERTIRLALAAYCDASELDPSDATLWFKLACAARALGREIDPSPSARSIQAINTIKGPPSSYRCLERLALERGISSLPQGVPPNRLLMRAWKEMGNWNRMSPSVSDVDTVNGVGMDTIEDGLVQEKDESPIELVLHLPRYSWVILGRILMRACREGVSYGRSQPGALHHVWSTNCRFPEDYEFGSPLIDVRISALLAIPPTILGRILEYLEESTDIKCLTWTCRAMSSELASARANITEENKRISMASKVQKDVACIGVTRGKDLNGENATDGANAGDAVGCDTDTSLSALEAENHRPKFDKFLRVSKRVQSLMITTEKQSERKSKRSSVEYCLLAGTLSCTAGNSHYTNLLKTDFNWKELPLVKRCMRTLPSGVNSTGEIRVNKSAQSPCQTDQANAFLAPASLNAFIAKWSRHNSGPRNLLEVFLIHVSVNTVDVFETDLTDSFPSCVIDSFDMVAGSTQWYGQEMIKDIENVELVLQVLSVNLLNAELRLKRCESHDIASYEHQDDSDILAVIIPHLIIFISKLSNNVDRKFPELQCRCYWLASSYHSWIGRCSNDSFISKASEDTGLEYLNKILGLLSDTSKHDCLQIKTPHLKSSDRKGGHWSTLSVETLLKHRDHLQSSSILSRARQSFEDIFRAKERSVSVGNGAFNITPDEKAKLALIGSELLERYNVNEKSSVFDELLSDCLLLHEDHLHAPDTNVYSSGPTISAWAGEMHWGRIWADIPSSKATMDITGEGSRPSIIQVLAFCLVASEEKTSSLFLVYSKLAFTSLSLGVQALLKGSSDDPKVDYEESEPGGTREDTRYRLLMLVVNFFIDKMTDMIKVYADQVEMGHAIEALLDKDDLCSLVFASLNISSSPQNEPVENSILQTNLSHSIIRLVLALRNYQGLPKQAREKIESAYSCSLVKALICQKTEFSDLIRSANDKRLKKWQLQISSKADLIFSTANEVAELLSLNPSVVKADGTTNVSHLITAITGPGEEESQPLQLVPISQLLETVLWFWKFLMNTYDASSPTENSVRNRLMVPISSVIIALCGSPNISVDSTFAKALSKTDETDKRASSFTEYFDSDDSVNGLFLPNESAEEEDQRSRRMLLRKMCQLVQCVLLVFRSVDEKLLRQEATSHYIPSSQHGPFLPLVVTRVLSNMSDGLFELFSEDFGHAYPFGARECGKTIDDMLGRAYTHLYGFSFSSTDSDSSLKYARYSPESIKAAAQLFRCLKRVYHDNRKTPPSRAYEAVELALPPAEETKVSKAIKGFLFESIEVENITADVLPGFPEWVASETEAVRPSAKGQDTIDTLRRGVVHELAKGSIDLDSNLKSPSDMEDQGGLSEERELTQSFELSLHQKFRAVLNDLCYNPTNIEGWIVLNECLAFKAEYICDRLVPIQESCGNSDFFLALGSKQSFSSMSLDHLLKSQLEEFKESRENWTPFIGNLNTVMEYQWSNLLSLQAFSKEVGVQIAADSKGSNIEGHTSDYLCWRDIESNFDEGDINLWANQWAGMIIMALRTMRLRALSVARYLAKRSHKIGMHPSEVSEDLGTALYGDLMASTVYGFPMHRMTLHEKRIIAERANTFFSEAVELSNSNDYTQKCQTIPFEMWFMIGKCHEKNASTLKQEMYPTKEKMSNSTKGGANTRSYETIMAEAIRNYSKSFDDAKKNELSSGGPDKACIGGSSHGALESLYRLHASRFKVLLNAIRRAKEECEMAELEAFRVTSVKWYDESNESSAITGVRGKTWDVFVDCVDALSHCLREVPLFHRAAYRLAQAYNYAPALHNPDCDLSLGSKQAVPAIKSYRVRGLDTEDCLESASMVISKLFEKRRGQLCAVWVTTSSAPSPHEVLNDSLRKFDSLRFKYTRAFIDCMHLTERKGKIETLLNWTSTTTQDLPSFYEASASVSGGDPGKHTKQSLLRGSGKGFITKVKRSATSALAELVLRDLAVMKKNGVDIEGKVKLTSHFRLAYTLFQRLNSPCEEVVAFIASQKPLAEAEAFCKCYLSIQAGYRISSINFTDMDGDTLCSILKGAISKAKLMMYEAKTNTKKEKEQEK